MKKILTAEGLVARLGGFAERLDDISKSVEKLKPGRPNRIYLAGAGASYAAALAARPAYLSVPGITGEGIEVLTPSAACLSGKLRDEGSFAVVFGKTDYGFEKNTVKICAGGDIDIDCADILCEYMLGAAAGILLAANMSGNLQAMTDELKKSTEAAQAALPDWDKQAEAAAGRLCKNVDAYETVGVAGDYAAATLARALIYSELGKTTTVEESEDWLHVNFLQLTPDRFGTMVFISSDNDAADRTLRTMRYIEGVGRKTVCFTDIQDEETGKCAIILPKLPPVAAPLFSVLPAALVVGRLSG